ncbi:MAG: hypothetical protein E6J90_10500 [Deltaproteobacteria bacterium]|nr:MAG: hypothetical protein E6J90_10500 [Deltaproteobacteria bacterium]
MRLAWLLVVAGCSASGPRDVVGPFTGSSHRFVIDRFRWPITPSGKITVGDDLDGNGTLDNKVAEVISSLDAVHDITTHTDDMIASGALASEIEIVADDLAADDTAGVYYHGVAGDQPIPVGGRLTAGGFAPNRTRDTRVPGEATLRLPIFADADPIVVRAVGLEIELTPDGTGGFDGLVCGGMRPEDLSEPEFVAVTQMITADPQDHLVLVALSDTDHDGELSRDEVASSLISAARQLDIELYDHGRYHPTPEPAGYYARDALSFGFTIHLSPCPSGRCTIAPPADVCHDRVRDGDETDVDCGGSCQRCPAAAACLAPADCQTGACDAGRCRAPSCSDGLLDGVETAVDCGGGCAGCAKGQRCILDHDCAGGHCTMGSCE